MDPIIIQLLVILLICCIGGIFWYLVDMIPLPNPIGILCKVAIVLLIAIVVVRRLGVF